MGAIFIQYRYIWTLYKKYLKSIQLNLVRILYLAPGYVVWDIGGEMYDRKIGVTDNVCLLSLIRAIVIILCKESVTTA